MLEHSDIFGTKPVVLIANQDADLRQLLCQTLEHHGFQVRTAVSGPEAVAAYLQHPEAVAAVLLEHRLAGLEEPEMSGALHRLRPYVPVCLLSESMSEDQVEELRTQGVRYVFTKPCNPEGVACLLQDIVNCAARELEASGVH